MDQMQAQIAALQQELLAERQARQTLQQAIETNAANNAGLVQAAANLIAGNNPNDQEKIKAACRANITKGPKYNGKRSFRVFASEFEIWRAVNRVSEIADVDFHKFLLLSCMEETAAQMVQGYGQGSAVWAQSLTLATYQEQISAVFQPPIESEIARDQFENRVQRKDEDISTYITSKTNLFHAAYPEGQRNFSILLSETIKGVYNVVIRRRLTYENPTNEVQLRDQALSAVAFERKCFKNQCSESVSLNGLAAVSKYSTQTDQGLAGEAMDTTETIQKLRGGQVNNKDRYCNFCKRSGHFEADCFQKQGNPNGGRPRPRAENPKSSTVTCNWCQKKGHIEKECRGKKSGRVPNRVPKPSSGKVTNIDETPEETAVEEVEDQEPFLDSEIPGEEDH